MNEINFKLGDKEFTELKNRAAARGITVEGLVYAIVANQMDDPSSKGGLVNIELGDAQLKRLRKQAHTAGMTLKEMLVRHVEQGLIRVEQPQDENTTAIDLLNGAARVSVPATEDSKGYTIVLHEDQRKQLEDHAKARGRSTVSIMGEVLRSGLKYMAGTDENYQGRKLVPIHPDVYEKIQKVCEATGETVVGVIEDAIASYTPDCLELEDSSGPNGEAAGGEKPITLHNLPDEVKHWIDRFMKEFDENPPQTAERLLARMYGQYEEKAAGEYFRYSNMTDIKHLPDWTALETHQQDAFRSLVANHFEPK